jgi:exosortase
LVRFSLTHNYGSHIVLIVPASAYLIYLKRHEIFSKLQTNFLIGSSLFLAGAILGWAAGMYSGADVEKLSLRVLAVIVLWISAFIICYGTHAFEAARFPLLFLLLLIPIPDFLIERIIFFLQASSATVAYWLLRILDVPVFKDGFILRFPTLDVEVAKECSGIRSSLALLITTLLVGEFVLRSAWGKSLVLSSVLLIVILKNGVRIVTISLLAIYVDRGFLHSWLHTSGGIVFYLLGLLSVTTIIILLKKWEIKLGINVNRGTAGHAWGPP